jgi:ribosome-associated translation inhibitor RaiA
MLIQVQTDRNIEGRDALTEKVETNVRGALDRYADRITRVQVHLGDENSDKKASDDDKSCTIEVRFAGLQPIAASDRAATLEQALDGAIEKMMRKAESMLGRKQDW